MTGKISSSKTMEKIKALQVATHVSPGATEGGVGRVDGATHRGYATPTLDGEPSLYYV